MTSQLKEFRQMLDAGRRYLEGSCTIQELNGHVSECATLAHFLRAHPGFETIAKEWSEMVDRRWNEWGHAERPLSEQKFREWLQEQVNVFPERRT